MIGHRVTVILSVAKDLVREHVATEILRCAQDDERKPALRACNCGGAMVSLSATQECTGTNSLPAQWDADPSAPRPFSREAWKRFDRARHA